MISIAPLKTWVVDILEERENDPNKSVFKMPFVVMSSGAKIYKADAQVQYKNDIKQKIQEILNGSIGAIYNGCVISNQTDIGLNYQSAETVVGFDFDGKQIKVEGENGRLISTPIIESIDVSSENSGILRQANVNVRCFSLKQFEMFELFFCKAQMDILLEWGEGSQYDILKQGNILYPKNDYTKFTEEFRTLCKPSTNQFKKYLEKCQDSKGTYDRMAGKLTNYQYSIESNGTYNIRLEISQGNEYNLALPPRFETKYKNIATPSDKKGNEFVDWKKQIKNGLVGMHDDFLDKLDEKEWKNDFFNWKKVNEDKGDEAASNRKYLSLRFILKVLMNNIVANGGTTNDLIFKIPNDKREKGNFDFFDVGGANDEIIPISINKNIISPSEDVLFPTETAALITFNKNGELIWNNKSIEDNRINGLSVIVNKQVSYLSPNSNDKGKIEKKPLAPKINEVIGNALNIFVDFGKIGDCWERAITRADFLAQILDVINANSLGMIQLRYGTFRQDQDATVVDARLSLPIDNVSLNNSDTGRKEYRFKPGTLKSNVREFSYNFELPNLLAGATLYNANSFLANIKEAKKNGKKQVDEILKELKPNNAIWKSIDYSSFANADGYYAINQIQYIQLDEVLKQKEKEKEKETKEDNVKLSLTNQKQIKKFKVGKLKYKTFVVNDSDWLYDKINNPKEGQASKDKYIPLPTPIDITVKIDGISGITFGELIKVDGVPEILNKVGHFYITDIKHNVDSQNGWTTTLVASFRWNSKT